MSRSPLEEWVCTAPLKSLSVTSPLDELIRKGPDSELTRTSPLAVTTDTCACMGTWMTNDTSQLMQCLGNCAAIAMRPDRTSTVLPKLSRSSFDHADLRVVTSTWLPSHPVTVTSPLGSSTDTAPSSVRS